MTEKKTNKDIISERSDMAGLKSTVSKNIPMDISQNSLLSSSEIGKKSSDKKNNDIIICRYRIHIFCSQNPCLTIMIYNIFLNRIVF